VLPTRTSLAEGMAGLLIVAHQPVDDRLTEIVGTFRAQLVEATAGIEPAYAVAAGQAALRSDVSRWRDGSSALARHSRHDRGDQLRHATRASDRPAPLAEPIAQPA